MEARKTNKQPTSCRSIVVNLKPGQSHCFNARLVKQRYIRCLASDVSRDYQRSYSVNMKGTEIKVTRTT